MSTDILVLDRNVQNDLEKISMIQIVVSLKLMKLLKICLLLLSLLIGLKEFSVAMEVLDQLSLISKALNKFKDLLKLS